MRTYRDPDSTSACKVREREGETERVSRRDLDVARRVGHRPRGEPVLFPIPQKKKK